MSEVELFDTRKKFGMVFQMSALFDSMDVFDNVAFPLREHAKMSRGEIKSQVEEALTALGVGHAIHKLPSELSGGMKKRVAVARALVMKPAILIYDEPTTGLDPITSRTVDELIESTRERFGVTSVVISHDMESVFTMGHHVTLLYKGQIEAKCTARRVRGAVTTSTCARSCRPAAWTSRAPKSAPRRAEATHAARRKTRLRLLAGIWIRSTRPRPTRCASRSTSARSRTPQRSSCALSPASKRALLSEVCWPAIR